ASPDADDHVRAGSRLAHRVDVLDVGVRANARQDLGRAAGIRDAVPQCANPVAVAGAAGTGHDDDPATEGKSRGREALGGSPAEVEAGSAEPCLEPGGRHRFSRVATDASRNSGKRASSSLRAFWSARVLW